MNDEKDTLRAKWHRFRKRPANDRELILRAAFILPVTEIGLRMFGFRRWKELIEKFSLPLVRVEILPLDLQHLRALQFARAVHSAQLHGPTTPNCLERSMTLWWMLRREGIEGELHIGARKQAANFEAHAWVELDGKVLNDGAEVHQHYARFDAPIAAALTASRPEGRAAASSTGRANS